MTISCPGTRGLKSSSHPANGNKAQSTIPHLQIASKQCFFASFVLHFAQQPFIFARLCFLHGQVLTEGSCLQFPSSSSPTFPNGGATRLILRDSRRRWRIGAFCCCWRRWRTRPRIYGNGGDFGTHATSSDSGSPPYLPTASGFTPSAPCDHRPV